MHSYLKILPLLLFMSCNNYGQLQLITKLPEQLSENSGIVKNDDASIWLIEDSGNKDHLYKIDYNGKIVEEVKVKNAKNIDWEDLAKDQKGNLYIGDFGNNNNDRKNLDIYKVTILERNSNSEVKAEHISFNYPEQKKFPPKKNKLVYDAEAFFYHQQYLYLFTRNRSKPFTGETYLYRIPAEKGNYDAVLVGKLKLCNNSKTCQITAADISLDGKKIALLSHGKLWILTDFTNENFTDGTLKEIDLGIRTQLEAVCFTNENTLLLSDEIRDNEGGNLYRYSLK